jgi:hypothetical protein
MDEVLLQNIFGSTHEACLLTFFNFETKKVTGTDKTYGKKEREERTFVVTDDCILAEKN